MSDIEPIKPTKTTTSERKHLSGRMRQLLEAVINEGADPYVAGQELNLHATSIRCALKRPDVIKIINQGRIERLGLDKARAQHRLMYLAMTNDQMPGVQACKTILGLEETNNQTRQTSPGVVIQIVSNNKDVSDNVSKIINNDET